jgi:hypothetical protein
VDDEYTGNMQGIARTYLMGIEIRIEDDDCVCAPQVDSNPASSSGEKIDENIGSLTIELIHALLSLRLFRVSVLAWGKWKLNIHVRVSLTRRRYRNPSPSTKSSMISRARTNCAGCIGNIIVSVRNLYVLG